MKRLLLIGLISGLAGAVYPQGQITLDNLANTSTDSAATANGLFWLSTGGTPTLINQDFNTAFYGGTDSSSLTLLASFLLSNGTAIHDNIFGLGTFVDPAGKIYTFSTLSSVFVQVQAWTGNFISYNAAVAGGSPAAQSPVFLNPVGLAPSGPAELFGMPAMVLGVPEPSTFALIGVGLLALLWRFLERRGASPRIPNKPCGEKVV